MTEEDAEASGSLTVIIGVLSPSSNKPEYSSSSNVTPSAPAKTS